MACTALIPCLVGAFVALGTVIAVLQRRSLAQSVCVRTASQLGDELGRSLTALTRLNPSARRLIAQHERAEAMATAARASGHPVAIALAEAQLRAVELAQLALSARQRALLERATAARLRYRAEFVRRTDRVPARPKRPTSGDPRPLAVDARPPTAIAPEYAASADFARRQSQTFAMDVALAPPFARAVIGPSIQRTTCTITLERKEHAWTTRIVAASAPSNWR